MTKIKTPQLLDRSVAALKGVGPAKAELLGKELGIFSLRDLLGQFPFRYVDKTKFHRIADLAPDSGLVQVKGVLRRVTEVGAGRKRLVGRIRDESGALELVWFTGVTYLSRILKVGQEYVAYGRISDFNGKFSISHPEMEVYNAAAPREATTFAPVYPSTEKLNRRGLDARTRRRMMKLLLDQLQPTDIGDPVPEYISGKFKFPPRFEAVRAIHFPKDQLELDAATRRLKFEELFFLQLRLLQLKSQREGRVLGYRFGEIGPVFNRFYHEKLPFELTGAQKRVLKEIRRDLGRGIQMNRLLQGDVGSGKTIVALLAILMALDNGFQTCLMAPTEILAYQHYEGISELVEGTDIRVAFLSGSVRTKARRELHAALEAGEIDILIGTHALIEPPVVFKNLGLAIIDEQHRFGVKQRAKLWAKNSPYPPHVLVMTATPIPRTLAMTIYGDLDISIIDELPPGRKQIETQHRTEHHRERVFGLMRQEITKGRQVYVVYPLIEENEDLDLTALEQGHEALSRIFPQPQYQLSVVHGKMKPEDKDFEMQRFKRGETQILVGTTVIEVGVNVPNATVMVIEHTERFGLSQLHQLRGRVGRGGDQSYCILMSGFKLSANGRERIKTMVRTTDGFEISEADLRLRGPGNMEGLQQSGVLNLKLADLAKDHQVLVAAREVALRILEDDPKLEKPHHQGLARYLRAHLKEVKGWGRIS